MGHLKISLISIPLELAQSLTAQKTIDEGDFDFHGEFATPCGQIPLSRLIDIPLRCLKNRAKERDLLNCLYSLQSPDSSPWKLPLVRLATNHTYDNKCKTMTVYIYVYFTRLIFEMIADPSIKSIIENLHGIPAAIVPIQKKKKHTPIFKPSNQDIYTDSNFKFTIPGRY